MEGSNVVASVTGFSKLMRLALALAVLVVVMATAGGGGVADASVADASTNLLEEVTAETVAGCAGPDAEVYRPNQYGRPDTVTVGTGCRFDPELNVRYRWQRVEPQWALLGLRAGNPHGPTAEVWAHPKARDGHQVTYRLTVTDASGKSASDDVTVTVVPLPAGIHTCYKYDGAHNNKRWCGGSPPPNRHPIACAPDQVVAFIRDDSTDPPAYTLPTVTLNASCSSDPDGDTLSYRWEQLGPRWISGFWCCDDPTTRWLNEAQWRYRELWPAINFSDASASNPRSNPSFDLGHSGWLCTTRKTGTRALFYRNQYFIDRALKFELTVTDQHGLSSSTIVFVTVEHDPEYDRVRWPQSDPGTRFTGVGCPRVSTSTGQSDLPPPQEWESNTAGGESSSLHAAPTQATACVTDLGALSAQSEYAGVWDDAACRSHHRADSPARYFRFSLSEETDVSLSLSQGALFVSKGTPKNGWGKVPGATYEHRINVRLANGKLVHNGAPSPTLTLPAGSYTAEAASQSGPGGSFTISIAPQ